VDPAAGPDRLRRSRLRCGTCYASITVCARICRFR
jgi:hypothetical protein